MLGVQQFQKHEHNLETDVFCIAYGTYSILTMKSSAGFFPKPKLTNLIHKLAALGSHL
jgi:hypothetical protein